MNPELGHKNRINVSNKRIIYVHSNQLAKLQYIKQLLNSYMNIYPLPRKKCLKCLVAQLRNKKH